MTSLKPVSDTGAQRPRLEELVAAQHREARSPSTSANLFMSPYDPGAGFSDDAYEVNSGASLMESKDPAAASTISNTDTLDEAVPSDPPAKTMTKDGLKSITVSRKKRPAENEASERQAPFSRSDPENDERQVTSTRSSTRRTTTGRT